MAFSQAASYSGARSGLGPAFEAEHGLAVAAALIGFSVLTLSLTYLMSLYSALVQRNVLALSLHHASGGTDDAAELLARLGPGGDFSGAAVVLRDLNHSLHELYEAHFAYPILHYFHFREPFYALCHMGLMIADLAALARSTLDRNRHRAFIESLGIVEAESSTLFLLMRLGEVVPAASLSCRSRAAARGLSKTVAATA